MKILKTVGCLALLCVIICGCVVLSRNTEVSAAEQEEQQQQETPAPPPEQEATPPPSDAQSSAGVSKTYSEGLYFRSNGDGTCALAGMGSCTATCVLIPPQSPAGDAVTEILPHAFAGSIVGSIEIPTTVQALSAASFADCARLAYIRVAAGNESLIEYDGALYTADGGVLLYCPSGRSARELKLHEGIRRIAAGAFATCNALDVVSFVGTTAEWHHVVVGDENNALYAARLVFVEP